jgi:hypothetical protein
MANRFYGLNNLATQFRQEDVTYHASATQSTDIEVRIDDTKSWSRTQVLEALEAISRRIRSGTNDLAVM